MDTQRQDKDVTELVRNYDHWSALIAEDPRDVWDTMRSECPVASSEKYGGFHILTKYEDISTAATDWKTFSSAKGVSIPPTNMPPSLPIEVDPPLHREYRRILNGPLSPQAADAAESMIREMAAELVKKMVKLERFDFAEHFSDRLPKLVVLQECGLPAGDREVLQPLIELISSARVADGEITDRTAEIMTLVELLALRTQEQRDAPDQRGVLGALVSGMIGDRPLGDDEIIGNMITVIFGGLHTTTVLLNEMVLWLVDHPQERQRLLDEPEIFDRAVEEFLRYFGPSGGLSRTVTRDVEVRGCPLKEGEQVMLLFGSANLDESHFEKPREIVLDRQKNKHLSFGFGPHRCVGSHLARKMVRVSLQELLPIIGQFEVADRTALKRSGGESRGLVCLPLVRIS